MKKSLIVLGLILLSTNCCFAKSPEYELELGRLKNAKSAKCKIINIQLNAISQKVTAITNDETISPAKKQELLEQYTVEMKKLEDEKAMANYTYQKSKKNLKKRY